jgi:hypothetical protein
MKTKGKKPLIKPRNPNLPKGTQKHEDKRKKEKYKNILEEIEE